MAASCTVNVWKIDLFFANVWKGKFVGAVHLFSYDLSSAKSFVRGGGGGG